MNLPQGRDKELAVRSMFDRIAPRYDMVNRIMTFGLDSGWRRRAVSLLRLERGDLVADVACGTGDLCREVERAGGFPIGFDVSFGMLTKARTDAPLVQGDGLRLPLRDGSMSAVTCGFALRNVIDISALFAEFARVLIPGGRVAVIEVAEPSSRLLRVGHGLYFRKLVPFIGGLLSDKQAYGYLPRSTAYLPDTPALKEMMRARSFGSIEVRSLGLGAAQLLTATRD